VLPHMKMERDRGQVMPDPDSGRVFGPLDHSATPFGARRADAGPDLEQPAPSSGGRHLGTKARIIVLQTTYSIEPAWIGQRGDDGVARR
jgi:hypothetical protein